MGRLPVRFTASLLSLLLVLALPISAAAQSSGSEGGDCQMGELDMSMADATVSASSDTAANKGLSAAEQRVRDLIREDGIHVVHLWAPWCGNSTRELANGWDELVRANEDVTFAFVTIWNGGADGQSTLQEYDLPERVVELTQPGGTETNKADRIESFLNLPVSWIPTTWIFHNNGELAFAMNYGEMQMDTLQLLIDLTRQDW